LFCRETPWRESLLQFEEFALRERGSLLLL
jgi:hypothetical protein